MKLNLGSGPAPLDGFENLDLPEWRFEDGLPYPDGSVEGISVSHAAMYVPIDSWPYIFSECARVLEPGGILRVTEDSTDDPESERFGGWHDAVTLTSPALVRKHMRAAGLKVTKRDGDTTGFRDDSLLQSWHGGAPKVFFLEGRKP